MLSIAGTPRGADSVKLFLKARNVALDEIDAKSKNGALVSSTLLDEARRKARSRLVHSHVTSNGIRISEGDEASDDEGDRNHLWK